MMKSLYNIFCCNPKFIVCCILMFIIIGCGNDLPDSMPNDTKEDVALSISTRICGESIPASRAPIMCDNFPPKTNGEAESYNLGTWVCYHEDNPNDFVAEKSGYNHMQVRLSVKGTGDDISRESTFIFRDHASSTLNVSRDRAIDIYSYYPMHMDTKYNTLKPDNVPFTTGETDWMWGSTSIDTDKLHGSEADACIHYTHAMTCLRIYVTALYNSSNVTYITLNDTKGRLYKKGCMDIATEQLVLDDADKTTALRLTYTRAIYTTPTAFYIIMPPLESFSEGELSLSFTINNKAVDKNFIIPTRMDNGNEVHGFERGKCYNYRLIVDNTISFTALSIDDTWLTNEYNFEL